MTTQARACLEDSREVIFQVRAVPSATGAGLTKRRAMQVDWKIPSNDSPGYITPRASRTALGTGEVMGDIGRLLNGSAAAGGVVENPCPGKATVSLS